jgi:hypothetical protein
MKKLWARYLIYYTSFVNIHHYNLFQCFSNFIAFITLREISSEFKGPLTEWSIALGYFILSYFFINFNFLL